MATVSFELEQFPQGYFLAWNVNTQCMNRVEVTLSAGNTVYFSAKKENESTSFQMINQSNRIHDHKETLILTISIPNSAQIKQSLTSGAISDQRARKVGYVYDICIEDDKDDDFNDVYVNIVGWARKG